MQEQVGTYPAAGVGVIEGGRVLTDRGTVIAPPDEFIADVSDAWTNGDQIIYPIFLSPRFPRVVKTDETVAVMSSHCSWWNYGHWLGDTLPRLHLLEKSESITTRSSCPISSAFSARRSSFWGSTAQR